MSNAGGSWQFIRRIAAQRDEVGYLFRIDAISLPNLFGPDARKLAAPRRVEDRCALRGELKGISIAARHYRGSASAFLVSHRSGEKVIRLEPWSFSVCKPAGGNKSRQCAQLLGAQSRIGLRRIPAVRADKSDRIRRDASDPKLAIDP